MTRKYVMANKAWTMQSQEGYLLTQDVVHTGLAAWAKLTSPVCTEVVMEKSGLMLIINKNSDLHLDTITLENSNSLLELVCATPRLTSDGTWSRTAEKREQDLPISHVSVEWRQ